MYQSPNSFALPAPHGGRLHRLNFTPASQKMLSCQDIDLTPRQRADLEMITTGAYSPLSSFMGSADWRSTIEEMRLTSGELWPIPITFQLPLGTVKPSTKRLRLLVEGTVIATIELSEVFEVDLEHEASGVYGTVSSEHPGVSALYRCGAQAITGEIILHSAPRHYVGAEYLTPQEARHGFEERGWRTVVAFQTRNPVHRAHEYLHKVALEMIDGLFLNPLVGETKGDDVPAHTRMEAYRVLLRNYYPSERVILGVYPAAMRYAGPKEAVLHALSRKNYGCTHFIVGRDHAGVGNYYGTYAAQEVFDTIDPNQLGISIIRFEHSFFCKRCEQVVSKRTCPHDSSHHLVLSGTKVRELLSKGEPLPPQFSRPEVAEVLSKAYAS